MKIPESLNLFGVEFKIIICDMSREKGRGCISYEEKTIHLDNQLSKEQMELILWHECFHFFNEFLHIPCNEVMAQAQARYATSIIHQLNKRRPKNDRGKRGRAKEDKLESGC